MTTFASNENKRMLWNVMIETELFAGLDDNKYTKVINLFEEVMNKLNVENEKPLNIKNKMVLSEMSSKLRLIKNSKNILSYELSPQYSSDHRFVENKKDAIEFTDEIHENVVLEEDLNDLIKSRDQIMKEVKATLPPPKTHENEKEINLLEFLNKDRQTKPEVKSEVFKDIKLTCQQLSDGFKKLTILMEKLESVINV